MQMGIKATWKVQLTDFVACWPDVVGACRSDLQQAEAMNYREYESVLNMPLYFLPNFCG